ncbi:hypothetical protein O1L60_05005 [Streptomyces diastatochromogenes]|nr:hypothetical protein [Streptomyces diastatochromogenes]
MPSLLMALDLDGWVVLVLEDVDGVTPAQPWRPDELRRVLAATAELSVLLDPSPVGAPTIADRFGEKFRGWRRLAAASEAGTDDLAWLDPWARRRLARLADREAAWTTAAAAAPWSTATCARTTSCSPVTASWSSTGRGPRSAPPGSTSSRWARA